MTKIAVVSDDGRNVSAHFGRAGFYLVATIQDGKVIGRKMRPKAGHHVFSAEPHHEEGTSQPHGFDAESQHKHSEMAAPVSDCEAVIAGGMGMGAYQSLQALGLKVIVTDIASVDEAVQAYIDGTIQNLTGKLH